MNTVKTRKRPTWDVISDYRGVLMGISIICIIIFHYVEDCGIYHVHKNGWVEFFRNYITSSSVDGFLFLSGFGLYYAMKKHPDISQFYKRRFTRILIPYFLIAIPALCWNDFLFDKTGVKAFFSDLSFYSFFTRGMSWFWYILLICFCYLIFPFIFRAIDKAPDEESEQMRIINLFTFFTMITFVIRLSNKELFDNTNLALLRIPFFCLGCFIGKYSYEKRSISGGTYGLMLLSLFAIQFRKGSKIIFARYSAAFLNISACILIAILFSKLKHFEKIHNWIKKFFEWFGKYSLELYLAHVTVRGVMRDYGHPTCYGRNELIMVAISIVLALIVNQLTKWIEHFIH
ncbi:acyltransferase [Clostridium sp. OM05-9]|jgi:peptidoglycan/LPS O-acetylase OafA/YrhL|uniref:acyltransferase family protein n=1 Tax=unclassified Clostridium TaxID=2614128 RepID=UPI000E49EBB0|nr:MULTISPECIES: acyltransferase [unclassified Clostridium]RGG35585.1 acyltransferase [Clostridium sp. AF23-6LB]RHS50900.1 acyltransferase [Clostridium sp. AM46-21]RHV10509.1 acyltransferase [Clostridium sp. OM05-9]